MHTGVGTFSGVKAKPESVMYYNNTKHSVEVPDWMQGRTPSKAVGEGGQWWSAITFSTWLGSMPASYSRSTSSRRAWRKVLQQLIELRAEYMEGKGAAAVGTRWAVVEETTTAAADTEAVRESCKRQTLNNATSLCVVTVQGERR